jgi:hypothetical protein
MPVLLILGLGCIEGQVDTNDTTDTTSAVELQSQYADCRGATQVDDDLDGVLEETHTLDYDRYGNLVRYTTDDGPDGVTNLIYDYTVTDSGEALVTDKDDDGDGVVDKRWTYLRDVDEWLESVEYDEGVDGDLEWLTTVTTTWNDEGQPLSVTSEKDESMDGTVEEVESRTYAYDSSGYWLTVETDYGNDGVVESRFDVRYDLEDVKQESEYDYGADGTVDKTQEFFYTDDGQTHRIDVTSYEADGSEVITRVFHEYTDASLISEINRDDGGDGSLDGATSFSWDCP